MTHTPPAAKVPLFALLPSSAFTPAASAHGTSAANTTSASTGNAASGRAPQTSNDTVSASEASLVSPYYAMGPNAASAAGSASAAAAIAVYRQQQLVREALDGSQMGISGGPELVHTFSSSSLSQNSHRDSISSQDNPSAHGHTGGSNGANANGNDSENYTQFDLSKSGNGSGKSLARMMAEPTPQGPPAVESEPKVDVPAGYPRQYAKVLGGRHPKQLPQSFNPSDKSSYIDVSSDNMKVHYVGPGEQDQHAGSIRTDHPIPRQCGIYYYEMTVESSGNKGYIGIGFCAGKANNDKLPGWEKSTWGYHGDDGHVFASSGSGRTYGPFYTTGDTIGCIINFYSNTISFTKNGMNLGVAFRNITTNVKRSTGIYPFVGLRTTGEVLTANFGTKRFVFDFNHHFEEEQKKLWAAIDATPLVNPKTLKPSDGQATSDSKKASDMKDVERTVSSTSDASNSSGLELQNEMLQSQTKLIHSLILSYLVHQGYTETATKFARKTLTLQDPSLTGIKLEAEVAKVIDAKDAKTRCKIKEYVSSGDYKAALDLLKSAYPNIEKDLPNVTFYLECGMFIELIRSTVDSGNYDLQSQGQSESADISSQMDIDGTTSGQDPNGTSDSSSKTTPKVAIQDIIQLGQTISRKYTLIGNRSVREALLELFSLISYPNPYDSPVSNLLDVSTRSGIANVVNFAILAIQNKPGRPPLEMALRQNAVVLDMLRHYEYGAADFASTPM